MRMLGDTAVCNAFPAYCYLVFRGACCLRCGGFVFPNSFLSVVLGGGANGDF